MRITRQSATELLLEDSGRLLLALGAACIAATAITSLFALREDKGAVALLVVCVFCATGVVMISRARTQTHHIDLRRGTLTISSRPALALLGTTLDVAEYRLDSVRDVVLEDGGSVGGGRSIGRTYRLAYVFADGARRPLQPYFTTGRSGYATMQETLRAALARVRRP